MILGKKYQEVWKRLCQDDDVKKDQYWTFFAGFMVGQAEKVYMGACCACMTAVEKEESQRASFMALTIASTYGLYTMTMELEHRNEIWIAKDEIHLHSLQTLKFDNRFRGLLCGIPEEDIDPNHEIDRPLR